MDLITLLLQSLAVALVIPVLGYVYVWQKYRKYKFPPTPPGRLPIIGHSHLLPKRFPGDKTKEWGMPIPVFLFISSR